MSQFFSVDFELGNKTAVSLAAESVCECRSNPCKRCRRFTEVWLKEIVVRLPRLRRYPDILGYTAEFQSGHLWSDRVVGDLVEASILSDDSVIVPRFVEGRPSISPLPDYRLLKLPRDLDLDADASGIDVDRLSLCALCGSILDGSVEAERYVPREASWQGHDLFMLRYPRLFRAVFCSRRVLELARKRRWVGFRFEPIDVERRHSIGWGGIDYLGKLWPPLSWYPSRPSEGSTAEEWLERYNTARDGAAWYDAWRALLDLGQQVVPLVLRQFEASDEHARLRAARLLVALERVAGAEIPDAVSDQARELWPDPSVIPERLS